MQGGGRSDLPDGLRQAGTTNDGRDEDSKTMRITTHCHGLYPRLQASTCETTKNYNIEHFALPLWFHNWRRFFKYNDKTHFKIGIQPRHRRLHRRFAAIRRNLHSQKNARHRPQTAERAEHAKQNEQEYSDGQIPISPFRADTSDNDPFSSEGGGSAVRKTGRLQYGSH